LFVTANIAPARYTQVEAQSARFKYVDDKPRGCSDIGKVGVLGIASRKNALANSRTVVHTRFQKPLPKSVAMTGISNGHTCMGVAAAKNVRGNLHDRA
tara:strand:+ start:23808 stop:24101 length:294 start_codon:yes stop_codon:yes gene_type:complete